MALDDVVKTDTRHQILKDADYGDLFKGSKRKRFWKQIGADYLSVIMWVPPHELMHAGVNKLLGGENKEIVFNKFFGGDLWASIIPGAQAKWMIPIIGGYVRPENPSDFAFATMALAPYAMTPLGIYMVLKGKKKENIPLTAAGSGLLAIHYGGIIGDWLNIGRLTLYDSVQSVAQLFDGDISSYKTGLLAIFGGFLVGRYFMKKSYDVSRKAITSIADVA